jgi:hypothetical protein
MYHSSDRSTIIIVQHYYTNLCLGGPEINQIYLLPNSIFSIYRQRPATVCQHMLLIIVFLPTLGWDFSARTLRVCLCKQRGRQCPLLSGYNLPGGAVAGDGNSWSFPAIYKRTEEVTVDKLLAHIHVLSFFCLVYRGLHVYTA